MLTFMRIVLFLMLKGGLTGGDGKSGTGDRGVVWSSMSALPGMLSIESDQNTVEQAITICTLYNPSEINRQADESNETTALVRVTMRFDTMKPELQKQISERLVQQLGGRLRFNWINTL